ncbi:MAG: hypothetical protein WCZ90_12855 [Melioribacteraceae bacterium]
MKQDVLEFSLKLIRTLTYIPTEVVVEEVAKDIWKITPDDYLNDQELESYFWQCKFLQSSIHFAQILYSLKNAVKKHTVRPEESFIRLTDDEKIFTYTFFLEAKNIKQLRKALLEFYKEVNIGLQKTPEESAKFFEQI